MSQTRVSLFREYMNQAQMFSCFLIYDFRFQHPFIYLTDCTCEKKNMEEMIRRKFEFEIDGILFYHQSVLYRSGQNPLSKSLTC